MSKFQFKRILCVCVDNMGDVLMSSPAIAALKETFRAEIIVLTSSMGEEIVPFIPCIDRAIVADFPWVKHERPDAEAFTKCVEEIRAEQFDAAFIFSVFSQNPLPSAMICYLAGIPEIFGYCRENPFHLMNHWIPDTEPYNIIRHQVERDLALVETAGATTNDQSLRIQSLSQSITIDAMHERGIPSPPYLVIHPGVSDVRRQYPVHEWVSICKALHSNFNCPLVFTGVDSERRLAERIIQQVGQGCHNLAGKLSIGEFIECIDNADGVISVNTSTVHIAAALHTPTIVLYAATNPQDTPWMVPHKVFFFPVAADIQSRNEVLKWVMDWWRPQPFGFPSTKEFLAACRSVIEIDQKTSMG